MIMELSIPFKAEKILGHIYQSEITGSKENKLPAVLVLHEITGITEHTKRVAQKFAQAGFVAIAPDLLGDKEVQEVFADMPNMARIAKEQGKSDAELNKEINERLYGVFNSERYVSVTLKKLDAWINYLKSTDNVDSNKISAVGFSFGAWYAFKLSRFPDKIYKAVLFYGFYDVIDESVQAVQRPVLGFYGELEKNNTEIEKLKELMKKYDKPFEIHMCKQAKHSFFDDTNPDRYNEAASLFAWEKTLEFLNS